jgi:uncharacterized repeat protein (TIGR01451 family)
MPFVEEFRVFRIKLGVCGAAAAFAIAAGSAVAAPAVHVALAGAIVVRDASGAERQPAPGERIRYTVMTDNRGADPARSVVSSARVPAGTQFAPGSAAASGPATVEFSLDGGKTWSARPLVKRHTPAGDVMVAAEPSAYTAIRWAVATLGAHERERFTYEVTVR